MKIVWYGYGCSFHILNVGCNVFIYIVMFLYNKIDKIRPANDSFLIERIFKLRARPTIPALATLRRSGNAPAKTFCENIEL